MNALLLDRADTATSAPTRPAPHPAPGNAPGASAWSPQDVPGSGRGSRFVLISDRTGGARPGVFERGLAVTDLLAPDFAVQLGDLIEGYTEDPVELDRQWAEIDAMTASLATPLFVLPGNHDVSNPLQVAAWRRRYGPTYRHLRVGDLLFCLLDTQDPPAPYVCSTAPTPRPYDPRRAREDLERMHDWNGVQPAALGAEQLDYFDAVLREHRDVRWTFLCMHMPLWQGPHPAWSQLRRMVDPRPYTAFAGHVHNYRHDVIDGRSHVRLGPTGGSWVAPGPDGNFDHVTLVTMSDRGPVLATVLLEGVRDLEGQPLHPVAMRSVPIF